MKNVSAVHHKPPPPSKRVSMRNMSFSSEQGNRRKKHMLDNGPPPPTVNATEYPIEGVYVTHRFAEPVETDLIVKAGGIGNHR